MARMTYDTITEVTDELLAMRWATDSAARMWFSRRKAAPGRLGLSIIEDDGEFRVEYKAAATRKNAATKSTAAPMEYEDWATEVDALLVDANEPPEEEDALKVLYSDGMTAANGAQRIINRRAHELEAATAPPKSTPSPKSERPAPPVVADTLADQAAAPHADSKPVLPAAEPASEIFLYLVTPSDMAPIVARRLSDITGCSVTWLGGRVDPRDADGAPRR